MSLLKTIKAQLGLSNTPANNFTLDASADNGTLKLARGNAGATTQDILTVDASGNVLVDGNNLNLFSAKSLASSGYQKLPSGLIIQWGTATLGAVGNYNTQVIAGVIYYTNYYIINYPIAFTTATYSTIVSLASSTFANQVGMAGHSVSSNLNGNGSPLTRFDVAVATPALGYVPTIHWCVIGR